MTLDMSGDLSKSCFVEKNRMRSDDDEMTTDDWRLAKALMVFESFRNPKTFGDARFCRSGVRPMSDFHGGLGDPHFLIFCTYRVRDSSGTKNLIESFII